MWTRERITSFLVAHPVIEGGSIAHWEYTREEKDDGDVYELVTMPLWSQNDCVTVGVLMVALAAIAIGGSYATRVYARDNALVINFGIHFCQRD